MEKRKGSVVDAFWSYHQAGAPMGWCSHVPTFLNPGCQWLPADRVVLSQWKPSSVGGYKPTEEGHPTVSNWWAQGWDTKDWGTMLHLMLQSSLCDQRRPDFSWDHVLAYFICPILIRFPHSFSPETSSSSTPESLFWALLLGNSVQHNTQRLIKIFITSCLINRNSKLSDLRLQLDFEKPDQGIMI